jgi:2',3'-cyclic-nucleotide 2'-phosphodiesterase (5'-nucleotidase family)
LRRVGVIGRAPADFFNVIRDPLETLPGLDFVGGRDPQTNLPLVSAVGQVLEEVDSLEARGVNIIVLIDHAQDFTADPLSAKLLRGIDIIVAAGSTGFMAKPEPSGPFNLLREGDTAEADYPVVREDSEGNQILVVNSDQQYRYAGNLMVEFDWYGHVTGVDDRSGPIATTEEAIVALEDVLGTKLAPPAKVDEVFRKLQNTALIQDAFTVVGTTTSELNGQRADVRSRETNLGRLASDSTLWYANEKLGLAVDADVALKNGGGIRDTILGPNITKLTIGAALAFDNKIAVVELTGDALLASMENAVSRVPALDGRFPQVAGLYLEYDASQPGIQGAASVDTPSRVKTLRVQRSDGTTDTLVENFTAGDLTGIYILATNDFLTTGGDGYAALAAAPKVATTAIGEQQILAEYIQEPLGGVVDLPEPLADPRVVRVDE